MKDTVMSVISIVQPAIDERHIEFQKPSEAYLQTLENTEYLIDEMRYEQVLINLLNNACKFTPEGGRIIWSQENRSHDEENAIDVVSISDTGCGMSDEFIARIGEPFMQEDNPYSATTTGTGLGLYIVSRILSTVGSTLEVKSTIGQGTTFCFELSYPYRTAGSGRSDASILSSDEPSLEHLGKALEGKHVLLVEDNEINREISKRLLEKVGMIVSEAENGQVACSMFDESEVGGYDAILMDIRMPVMDGYAATRHIRTSPRADARVVPLIAMTANAFVEDVKKSMDVGMTAYLSKPVDPLVLYRTLALHCR